MARANLTPTASAVLAGDEDLSQWSDEELLRGRKRNKRGTMSGRAPKVVPTAILHELTRRRFTKAEEVVRESLVAAVELWKQIVEDDTVPLAYRLKASELIVDRAWGKPKERISAEIDLKEPNWMRVLRQVVKVDGQPVGDHPAVRAAEGLAPLPPESEIIDAEVIEDEPGPFVFDPEDDDEDPVIW
jgi:hypothetical protein